MKTLHLATAVSLAILFTVATAGAQHDHMKGMDMPMKHSEKTPGKAALKPAEGASIKIVSPKKGQVFNGDRVPIEFKLTKGKRGHHAHAYVDGQLMGMFESETGTLNGVKPGQHTIELRVVTADHVEINATDKVSFRTE